LNVFDDTFGGLAAGLGSLSLEQPLGPQLTWAAAQLARAMPDSVYADAALDSDEAPDPSRVGAFAHSCITGACACVYVADKPTKSQRRGNRLAELNIRPQDYKPAVYAIAGDVDDTQLEALASDFCESVENNIGGHLHTTPGFPIHGPTCEADAGWGAQAMAATATAFLAEGPAAEDQFVPKTLRSALSCRAKDQWADAMRTEVMNLHKNNTYTICKPGDPRIPANIREVLVRMHPVFRVKGRKDGTIEKYKVRITADGRTQVEGLNFDDTFAPVARIETLRTFLVWSCRQGRKVKQMDFEAAFLQAELVGTEIWFRFSDEFYDLAETLGLGPDIIGERGDYMLLNKSIYGIKQAGLCWNKLLDADLVAVGFEPSEVDNCLYHLRRSDGFEMDLALYVDDCLYSSNDEAEEERVLDARAARGRVFDRMGEASWFLAMGIEQSTEEGHTTLTQESFARSIVKNSMFGDLSGATATRTPCSTSKNVDHDAMPDQAKLTAADRSKQSLYRRDVGKIMYLARLTRPDIHFAVNRLARFSINPGDAHYTELAHLIRYIKGTTALGLHYRRSATPDFLVETNAQQGGEPIDMTAPEGWGDADHAGEASTRESQSAGVVRWHGAALAWVSEKQNCIALSTCEAELIALSRLVQEVVYIRKLIRSFSGKELLPTITFCDNKGALDLVANNKTHKRTKHIELRFFYCRRAEQDGQVRTARTPTERNLSDDLSKPVDWDTIKDHRFGLHGMDLLPSGDRTFEQVINPSSKIKAPTPASSSRRARAPAAVATADADGPDEPAPIRTTRVSGRRG